MDHRAVACILFPNPILSESEIHRTVSCVDVLGVGMQLDVTLRKRRRYIGRPLYGQIGERQHQEIELGKSGEMSCSDAWYRKRLDSRNVIGDLYVLINITDTAGGCFPAEFKAVL